MSTDFVSQVDVSGRGAAQTSELVGGSLFYWASKRLFDIALSIVLLLPFGALVALVALLNPFLNPGPIFFRQERMGRDCESFVAIKFRSMVPVVEITRGADDEIEADRIGSFGEFLRKTRIDELPQILNVLRGDMSLIGPRPDYYEHALEYLANIPGYEARHVVRPGISGLAQVMLGYAAGLDATRAKVTADLSYIRNAGFGIDLRVFWLTLVTVALRRGA